MRIGRVSSKGVRWLLAVVVFATAVIVPIVPAAAIPPVAVSGRVTNASGTGIPGVIVSAVNSMNYYEADYGWAETDANGYYYIMTLEAGTPTNFLVMFDPLDSNFDNDTDYLGEFYNDYDYPLGAPTVSAGATNVNAVLEVGGRISGTVYAPGGVTPLPDIEVEAATGFVLQPWTMTEDGGTYILRGVAAPGSYNVFARPDFYNTAHGTSYDDGKSFAMVSAGTLTSGVNITLGGSTPPPPPTPVTLLPVYRFFNLQSGMHVYTASETERAHIKATWPTTMRDEGLAYYYDQVSDTATLHRLFNVQTGTHFYTASETELSYVLATWPTTMRYEGPAYPVSRVPSGTKTTVYRFFNLQTGTHFYTGSASEADYVRRTWPTIMRDEGPAFYVGQ